MPGSPSTNTPTPGTPASGHTKRRRLPRLNSRTRARLVASRGVAKPPPGEETTIALWRPLPGATFKKEPEPTEEERSKLEEMKAHAESMLLPEDDPYHAREKVWVMDDPGCLLRFLRAAKGNLAEGKDRYTATCKWRREFKPDLISPKDIWDEAETGKVILTGFDSDGRPVLYLRPARENSKNAETKIKHLVYQLERCCDLMNNGVTKMALVVDYHGAGAKSNPGMAETKQVLEIFQRHYAERLGRAIIVNLPWYLSGFFKAISPLLDPVSREKMKFNANMTDLIPSDQLVVEFGGTYNFKYDRDVYFPALAKFCGVNDDGTRVENPPVRQDMPSHLSSATAVSATLEDDNSSSPSTPAPDSPSSRRLRLMRGLSAGPRAVARKLTAEEGGVLLGSRRASERSTRGSESPGTLKKVLSLRSGSTSGKETEVDKKGRTQSLPMRASRAPSEVAGSAVREERASSGEETATEETADESEVAGGRKGKKKKSKSKKHGRPRRGTGGSELRKKTLTKAGWKKMLGIKDHHHDEDDHKTDSHATKNGNGRASPPGQIPIPSPHLVAGQKTVQGLMADSHGTEAEAARLESDVHQGKSDGVAMGAGAGAKDLSAAAAPTSAVDQHENISALPTKSESLGLVQVGTPTPATAAAASAAVGGDAEEGAGMALVATGGDVLDRLHHVIGKATAAVDSGAKTQEEEVEGVQKGETREEELMKGVVEAQKDEAVVLTDRQVLERRITENSATADDLDFTVSLNGADCRRELGNSVERAPKAVAA